MTEISLLENNNVLIFTSLMFSALLFLTPFLIPYFISKSLSYYDEKKIIRKRYNLKSPCKRLLMFNEIHLTRIIQLQVPKIEK